MDLNLVVLCGSLSGTPELRVFDSGARLLRMRVKTKAEEPHRRIDVIPVKLWDPPPELLDVLGDPTRRLWITGSVRRRFWEGPDGRRSEIEVVADHVTLRPPDLDEASEPTRIGNAAGREDAAA